MKLLAYGVIPSTTTLPSDTPPGLAGDPLRCAWGDALGLVYSNCPPLPWPDDLPLRYTQVIESLHQHGTLLPFRNGCLGNDESELLDILREHESDYHALLDDLRDCEEMSIRIIWDDAAKEVLGGSLPDLSTIPDEGDISKSGVRSGVGRNPRASRRDPQTAQADYVRLLCERYFTGLMKLSRAEWLAHPSIAIRLQFLVERKKSREFSKRFAQFNDTFAVNAHLAGPQPLFTFSIPAPLGCQGLPEVDH